MYYVTDSVYRNTCPRVVMMLSDLKSTKLVAGENHSCALGRPRPEAIYTTWHS